MNSDIGFALACAATAGVLALVVMQPQAWPVLVTAAIAGAVGYAVALWLRRR